MINVKQSHHIEERVFTSNELLLEGNDYDITTQHVKVAMSTVHIIRIDWVCSGLNRLHNDIKYKQTDIN
jgi:hypothetical protein